MGDKNRVLERQINDVQLDGEPQICHVRRPSIKLADKPYLVIAIPMGEKEVGTVFECPECNNKWYAPGHRAPHLVSWHWMTSHMNTVPPMNCVTAYLAESGRLSAEARQIMTKKALRMGAKYILYWDDDVTVPEKGIYDLMNFMEKNPEAGAVSGVYTTRETPQEPLIYKEHGKGCYWDMPMGEGASPVPIFAAGAGFIMARLEAVADCIEKLKEANGGKEVPIWADERTLYAKDGPDANSARKIMWGHDIRFCKILNEHGWQVWGHGQVLCGHIDVATSQIYYVPSDAPGLNKRANINTKSYWDSIYTKEGANTWRQYPEMFSKIVDEIHKHDLYSVLELGCGVGILGSRIVASRPTIYKGYDLSEEAVRICKDRFLDVEQLDVSKLSNKHVGAFSAVVMSELVEHLDEDVFSHVFDTLLSNEYVDTIIFTAPDGTMPPEEVAEHTAAFDRNLVRDRLKKYSKDWKLSIKKADSVHMLCTMERKNAKQKSKASPNDACCGARQGICKEDGNTAECCQGVCEVGQAEEEGEA